MDKKYLLPIILTTLLSLVDRQAQAMDTVILQLRWDHQFQFAGYYAAEWQGYYRYNGIDVDIRSAIEADGTIISATEAVAENRADFGIGAADILVALDHGNPLRILASIFQKSAVAFFAAEAVKLNHPSDLVDLRVSRRPGDMVDVEMQAMLLAEGIDPELVETYPFDQRSGYFEQMKAGKIDVVPGYIIGTPHAAMKEGMELARLRPIDYGVDFYGDSLFTSAALIAENPELVERFKEASLQGWKYALEHPQEIADRIVATFTPRFPIRNYASFVRFQIEPVRELMLHQMVKVGNINPARWARMHETLKALNMVENEFTPEKVIFDPALFRKARQEQLQLALLVAGVLLSSIVAGGMLWIIALRRSVGERTQALLLQKEQYRELIEKSPAIIYSFVPGHGGIYYSPQVNLLGYTPGELTANPMIWHESIHPDDLPAVNHVIEGGKTGELTEVHYRICHRNGHWLWFLDRTYSRRRYDGQVTINGVVLDITATKKAEEALRASERKWRHILVNTPQLGIILDPQGSIVFANEHFLRVTGWKQEEILGRDWFDLFIPEKIRTNIKTIFRDTVHSGDMLDFSNYENTILTKSGALIDVSWSNLLAMDDAGKIANVTSLGIDLTERKEHENFLERINTDLKLAQRIASIGFWSLDPEIGIPQWSEEVYRIFERDRSEGPLPVTEFKSICRGKWWTRVHTAVEGAIQDGTSYDIELKVALPSGRQKWIHALGEPEPEKGPKGYKLRGTIQDITEMKLADEALRHSQKSDAIGTLAGGIAHEFNNMLGVILGNAELAEATIPEHDPVAENLRDIKKASLHARDVVSRLLKVARKRSESRTPIEIRSTIEDSLTLLRKTIPTSVEIMTDFTCTHERVMADPTEISQVLINLCTNAIHAMPKGQGLLQIRLAATTITSPAAARFDGLGPGEYADLTVVDDGHGIPEEILHRVFDPYFTTKDIDKGLGMGLAVVQGIVKKCGGAITIASDLDTGTTVRVLLPLTEETMQPAAQQTPSHGGQERILVVDDEPDIVVMITQLLEHSGYDVVAKNSSVEALKTFHIDPEDFDLVLTDMAMPIMTGEELAKQIKEIRPDIPIILITGYSDYVDSERAAKLNIADFLMKPVTRADLNKSIRKALDAGRKHH